MGDISESLLPRSVSDVSALRQRYRNPQLLGQGGLAEVYRVEDARTGAEVALKRMRVELAVDGKLERIRRMFEAEYHTLKQLQHPSIIAVYDYGVDPELGPYYTMEILSGQDLRELAPVPWRDACRLLMDVASSLAVIHSRGLVHRDVTPRNVRRTADGRAKLLDFGTLTEVGVVRDLSGTPAYVAPETVTDHTLDARADLYSLGALAYYILTGQHAFPARDFIELRDRWRVRPASVCKFDPGIPRSLNALVMALLEVDPLARPQTAAEVTTRLSALADVLPSDGPAAAHAYLNAPKLIARDAVVTRIRAQLVRALRGRGGTLLFEGEAGVGRSRVLDACALEGQLAGVNVLRADASDLATPLGGARRLLSRLLEAKPALEARVAELGLTPLLTSDAGLSLDRREIIARLVQLFTQASERSALLLVIDDLHLLDEPSLALLTSLAAEARERRLLLALSAESSREAEGQERLKLIVELAYCIRLVPLSAADTRALLASLFGEVPALDLLAGLLHDITGGNPRQIMHGAQCLVDGEVARYEGAHWSLSDDPEKLRACLERGGDVHARLSGLSADALELLQVLALDRDHRLDDSDYEAICAHRDPGRVHAGLRDLTRERWLLRTDGSHHFVHGSDRRGVIERLSEADRASVHARIAERLESQQRDALYELYHFVQAGQAARAHGAMRRYLTMADENPHRMRALLELETVSRLVEVGSQEGWPRPLLTLYRTQLILLAAAFGTWELVLPQAQPILEALSEYAGLADYQRLHQLPPAERLPAAMAAAKARFEAEPEGSHPLPPLLALRSLVRACTMVAASAYWMVEPSAFARIPSLAPLVPLSAALSLTERIVQAFRALAEGREWTGWDAFKQLYRDVRATPEAQLDARSRYTLELVVLSPVCFRDARHAASTTLAHCAALAPTQPDQAQNYTMLYYVAIADAVEAARAREKCELLMLRAGATNDTRLTRLQTTAFLYPMSDDLMGLKRTLEGIGLVCERRPGWRFTRDLCRAHVLRCRGKLEEALLVLEGSLTELPDAHFDFGPSAEAHVLLLTQLGRAAEALERGTDYLARAARRDVPTAWLELALSLCLSALQRHEEAETRWESARLALTSRDIGGIHLGYAYEVGARLALANKSRSVFTERSARCAEYYLHGRSPALAAKYKHLLDAARAQGSVESELPPQMTSLGLIQMRLALAQCRDRGERGVQALRWLCEQTGAADGVLFGIRGGFLEPLGSDAAMPLELITLAQEQLGRELEGDLDATLTEMFEAVSRTEFPDTPPDAHVPLVLRSKDDLGEFVVGLAMLRRDLAEPLRAPSPRFVLNLTQVLLAVGDVDRVRVHA